MQRKHTTVPRACRQCGRRYLAALDGVRRGKGLYCSFACAIDARRKPGMIHLPERVFGSVDVVQIPLRARDGSIRAYATVDAADAEWVNQWRWSLDSNGYAHRSEKVDGRNKKITIHRELLGLPRDFDGVVGDHIDGNTLNDRRSNLRRVTPNENGQNVRGVKNKTSQHRGVSWNKHRRKWNAVVFFRRKKVFDGWFEDESEAADAARLARFRFLPFSVERSS